MEQLNNEKKKVKLNLEDIKIQSFVTSLDEQQQNEIMGASCPATACSCCLCTTTGCC
jgi:hypothetical protein